MVGSEDDWLGILYLLVGSCRCCFKRRVPVQSHRRDSNQLASFHGRLDFIELYPKAPMFDLIVFSTQEFEASIFQPSAAVAGSVYRTRELWIDRPLEGNSESIIAAGSIYRSKEWGIDRLPSTSTPRVLVLVSFELCEDDGTGTGSTIAPLNASRATSSNLPFSP
jgi:hypothetical protein